jgi:TonB family protein
MPDTAQHLLGQLADGRFPLRKLLGVSSNSAVFLTSVAPDRPSDPAPDAAIKLIPEDPSNSAIQLERWNAAAALSHPGILRILYHGRCVVDGSSCLYLVTELADEDLGQLLPQRALTPEETRGMLAPILAALDFLHENGLVHAGLKPSNIHAIGDNVKLSADRIVPAGESASSWPFAAPYAAPESVLFPASDIWSLGMSLCETLTQNLPLRDPSGQFALSKLPAPFLEIVRSALVEDATLRVSLESVLVLLDPTFVPRRKSAPAASRAASTSAVAASPAAAAVANSPEALIAAVETAAPQAAAAAASASPRSRQREPLPEIDPLSVPLSPVSPTAASAAPRARIPVSSLPQINATIAGPRRVPSPLVGARSNKLFLVSLAAALVLAVLFIPRLLVRSSNSSSNRAPSAANQTAPPLSPKTSAKPDLSAPATSSAKTSPTSPSSKPSSKPSPAPSSGSLASPNASPRPAATDSANSSAPSAPSTAAAKNSTTPPHASAALEVTHKVLPEVSEKSRSTIHGTVRINVRVQLNPDGTVASAALDTPAGSQFFANLALKAAQQWRFAPSASSSPSAVIRFDFTQTATAAYLP